MQKFMPTSIQQNDSSVKFAELEGDFELVKNDVEHIKASVDRIDTTLKQTNSLLTNIAQIQTSQTHTENSLNTLKKDFKEYTEDNNNQIKDFSLFRTKITTSIQIITASIRQYF
jgi:chromosome segregation ATPase